MLPRFTIGIPKIYEYNRQGNDTMLPAIILDMRDTARRTLAEGRGPESVRGRGLGCHSRLSVRQAPLSEDQGKALEGYGTYMGG